MENYQNKPTGIVETDINYNYENRANFHLSPSTVYHFHRVARLSFLLGEKVVFDKKFLNKLLLSSFLHDIGKLYIPEIIQKTEPLNLEELKLIHLHVLKASGALKRVINDWDVLCIIIHHHERWDGCGYPDKLIGKKIPLGSRIIAIADTYDAITSNRSYHNASSHKDAIQRIKASSGSQFDPNLVEIFCQL